MNHGKIGYSSMICAMHIKDILKMEFVNGEGVIHMVHYFMYMIVVSNIGCWMVV